MLLSDKSRYLKCFINDSSNENDLLRCM
uniref:Uncharacterized protein n=1 Tax=Arundo donax TaxID=35708 RepID=A0A0A9ABR8_ARUDO